jgi:hypothetical protein
MSLMTTFDAIDVVYQKLLPIKTAISGGLYKLKRPESSVAEDCVINSLGMPGDQVQQGIINVNLHVPNLVLRIDNTQPDFKRMQQLAALAITELKEFYSGFYWFLFQQQNMVESGTTESIVNIRIEFYSINL